MALRSAELGLHLGAGPTLTEMGGKRRKPKIWKPTPPPGIPPEKDGSWPPKGF